MAKIITAKQAQEIVKKAGRSARTVSVNGALKSALVKVGDWEFSIARLRGGEFAVNRCHARVASTWVRPDLVESQSLARKAFANF